jgi:hypothetical protein
VTPALSAVYDELLARASSGPHRARALSLRDAFLRRTASSMPQTGAQEPEERLRAAWDDALTRGGLAAQISGELPDPGERALARVLSRAHRAVFRMEHRGPERVTVAVDLISGGAFILLARDDIGREVLALEGEDAQDAPLFEARVVAATDGCAMLPGVIFHPPDATPLIGGLISMGQERGMARDDLCDALLRMQDTFRNLSRVKIGYAYKPEALSPGDPQGRALSSSR